MGIETTDKPIVLWKKPLIEIIEEMIFIDDVLVWKSGKFIKRDDLRHE